MEELEEYRQELINSVKENSQSTGESLELHFLQEVAMRLTEAEEFEDFIPSFTEGSGQRNRKVRVDGYEVSDLDDSVRLLISDFSGENELTTLTKGRLDALLGQLRNFIEEALSGRYSGSVIDNEETREIANWIENYHEKRIKHYDLYLLTDCRLSERVSHVKLGDIAGVPVRAHVWDISRMYELSQSAIGAEELEIDFEEFGEALPCLAANTGEGYESFLCVIPAETLTTIFDQYGGKLLEGNVRSFLTSRPKVNQGIQKTIRAEPEKFFVFNNGISATGTTVRTISTNDGLRIKSVKYLQLVNGGQTTASLSIAKRVDKADLSQIFVPMKLTIVSEADGDKLNQMIQDISRSSNSQNKVSDTDFFSNHPFHRDFEVLSRNTAAPRKGDATYATFWYYERLRGQYQSATSKMTPAQKKEFAKINPRPQKLTKTDLAKFENSWGQMPHEVSKGAQKNFPLFAKAFDGEYSTNMRAKFNNPHFFRAAIARAILFKGTEAIVSSAKGEWYSGDWRAQIVTYTIAKLANMLSEEQPTKSLDFLKIWNTQKVSEVLAAQLEDIAKNVCMVINQPATTGGNVGEWSKKLACWEEVKSIEMNLNYDLVDELVDLEEVKSREEEGKRHGKLDIALEAEILVMNYKKSGAWTKLLEWSQQYQPLYGKELDLIKLAAIKTRIQTPAQARAIVGILEKQKDAGFTV